MSSDPNAEREQEREKEYTRWQGYANALLLALTVLFAGTAISLPNKILFVSITSVVAGLAGIVSTVSWFALEDDHKCRGKPRFLVWASCAFGLQAGFLFIALLASLLQWNL